MKTEKLVEGLLTEDSKSAMIQQTRALLTLVAKLSSEIDGIQGESSRFSEDDRIQFLDEMPSWGHTLKELWDDIHSFRTSG